MTPTTLKALIQEKDVILMPQGISITIQQSWIVKGEDRLSYTTLIRLVECCREHHWRSDIESILNNKSLDSICKSLSVNFIKPIKVGSKIIISYVVQEIRRTGYSLKFMVHNAQDKTLCAEVDLLSVFYNPKTSSAVIPPPIVIDQLANFKKLQ